MASRALALTRRLAFIVALALGIFVAPLVAAAEQPGKVPRIGYLRFGLPPPADVFVEGFRQGLRDLGYVEGQTIVVEYRWAGGRSDRAAALAAELVRLKVDVIVTTQWPALEAAMNATKTIPIVIGTAPGPVEMGFVASLARPGGNITGLSLMTPELSGKQLELLRETLPGVTRVAFLGWGRTAAVRIEELQVAAQKIGVQIQPVVVKGPDEFEAAFSAMIRHRAGALIVHGILNEHRRRIVDLAARNRLPAISFYREFADAGGLMSYGPDFREFFPRAAYFVDKILKGARPGDLPIEQPTKFHLVINLKTAKALGLAVTQSLLLRADQIIE